MDARPGVSHKGVHFDYGSNVSCLLLLPLQITAGQVVFWDVDFQKLQLMHQLAMYPPRFAINIAALGATAKVCAQISFKGALEDPDLDTELLLQPIPTGVLLLVI